MKTVWLCLSIALLGWNQAQAQVVNWRAVWGVTGEVQAIHEEYRKLPPTGDEATALPPTYRLEITFNRQGGLVSRTLQDSPWARTCEQFQPDALGRPAAAEIHAEYYALKPLVFWRYWLTAPYLKERKLVNRLVIKYDERHRIVEQSTFKPDGTLVRQSRYRYDNLLQVIDTYDGDENLVWRESKLFDAQGRLLESGALSANNEVKQKMVYEYSAQGPRQRLTIYDGAGLTTDRLHYDEHGEPLEHWQYDPQGKQTSLTNGSFEYDEQGNWRKAAWTTEVRLPGKTSVTKSVTYRRLKYFPTQGNRE